MNINGLTKHEIEFFLSFCIKANNHQIEAMRTHLNNEIRKRELIINEIRLMEVLP